MRLAALSRGDAAGPSRRQLILNRSVPMSCFDRLAACGLREAEAGVRFMPKTFLSKSSMPKARSGYASGADAARPATPTLGPSVRRHLGHTLRSFYADILSDPPGARLEALLARLGKGKR